MAYGSKHTDFHSFAESLALSAAILVWVYNAWAIYHYFFSR